MVLSVVNYVPRPLFRLVCLHQLGFVVTRLVNLCVCGYIYTVHGTASIWKHGHYICPTWLCCYELMVTNCYPLPVWRYP